MTPNEIAALKGCGRELNITLGGYPVTYTCGVDEVRCPNCDKLSRALLAAAEGA